LYQAAVVVAQANLTIAGTSHSSSSQITFAGFNKQTLGIAFTPPVSAVAVVSQPLPVTLTLTREIPGSVLSPFGAAGPYFGINSPCHQNLSVTETGLPATLSFTSSTPGIYSGCQINYAGNDYFGEKNNLPLPAMTFINPTTVTINQARTQADPTNGSPINFTVVFSQRVTDFATGDVNLSAGTAPGTLVGTVSEIAPNDGTTYNVAVSGMTGNGTVVATILAGVAHDAASFPNVASTSTDNTVAYDGTAPTVAMSSATPNSTNTSPIPVTVQFSETVTGFLAGDIIPTNGTVNNFTAVDGDTYTFDLAPTGPGPLMVSASIAAGVAVDTAGNSNTAAPQLSRTYTGP
jgi:hypothetical protein